MVTVNTTTLRAVSTQYNADTIVRILDNGKKIFMGRVGAISKSFKAPTLDRKCEVYENETLDIFLQRKVK